MNNNLDLIKIFLHFFLIFTLFQIYCLFTYFHFLHQSRCNSRLCFRLIFFLFGLFHTSFLNVMYFLVSFNCYTLYTGQYDHKKKTLNLLRKVTIVTAFDFYYRCMNNANDMYLLILLINKKLLPHPM